VVRSCGGVRDPSKDMAPGASKDARVRPEAARREQVAAEPNGKAVSKSTHEKTGGAGLKTESSNVPNANRKSSVSVPSKSTSLSLDTGAGSSSGGSGISSSDKPQGVGGLDRRLSTPVRNPRGLTADLI
jgi:hypothetical protein